MSTRSKLRILTVFLACLLGATVLAVGASASAADHSGIARKTEGIGVAAFQHYQLRAQHSNKCLDVENYSHAEGADVHQYGCVGQTNQHWRMVPVGNGYYELRAQHSNKCLDVENYSHAEGADVHQYGCVGQTNQHWRMVPVGNGYYELRAQHSNKCLDVENYSHAEGADVHQYGCVGQTNQHWRLVGVQ